VQRTRERSSAPIEAPDRASPRLVVGLQPVREAIRAHGSRLGGVLIEVGSSPRLQALARFAEAQAVRTVERVPRAELDRLSAGVVHQGAAAWAPALTLLDPAELLTDAALVALALDGIQDPQNFGALVRSAVAVVGAAVVWGEHSAAPLSPATFRASAGAIEHARLCRVPSLAGMLTTAAIAGAQVVGLDPQAPAALRSIDLTGPTVLVIGAEHEGLKRGVRRACSAFAHLVPPRQIDSLNASVAAAIALYECANQRALSGT
jgi:23S rRNA (guanosine2251-2'-O)-methyltransferase